MARYILTGGKQRANASALEEWFRYEAAVILVYNDETNEVEKKISYVSPPEAVPENGAAILFKSATLQGNKLFICTQTEVLVYELPSFERVNYISHPYFNDVHHVVPYGDDLLVAATGLDAILHMKQDGELIDVHYVLDGDIWERFDKQTDYRKVLSTKPHLSHPNFIGIADKEVWISRFKQQDTMELFSRQSIPIEVEKTHDGHYINGHLYFTTVNGHIIEADPKAKKVTKTYDLNSFENTLFSLGWCRGLHKDGDKAVVGFSRIRHTKSISNLSWLNIKKGLRHLKCKPTHLGFYDLKEKKLIRDVNLETLGIDGIFSILKIKE